MEHSKVNYKILCDGSKLFKKITLLYRNVSAQTQ